MSCVSDINTLIGLGIFFVVIYFVLWITRGESPTKSLRLVTEQSTKAVSTISNQFLTTLGGLLNKEQREKQKDAAYHRKELRDIKKKLEECRNSKESTTISYRETDAHLDYCQEKNTKCINALQKITFVADKCRTNAENILQNTKHSFEGKALEKQNLPKSPKEIAEPIYL